MKNRVHQNLSDKTELLPTTFHFIAYCSIDVSASDREIVNGTIIICAKDSLDESISLKFTGRHILSEKSSYFTFCTKNQIPILEFSQDSIEDGKVYGDTKFCNEYNQDALHVLRDNVLCPTIAHCILFLRSYCRTPMLNFGVSWSFAYHCVGSSEFIAITDFMNL